MNSISLYLLNILGVILLGIVIEIVLPNNKISKYIKSLFAIFIVAVIFSPIVSLIKNGWELDSFITNSQYSINNDLISVTQNQEIAILSNTLEQLLFDNGYKNAEVLINANFENNEIIIKAIFVDLSNLVINNNLAHIDYYTAIKVLIVQQLNVEEALISIYG